MAQRDSGLSVETTGEGGHRSGGSYTVTLDTNPSVEQVQTYITKPLSPTGYVPSSSDFDFMSSSLGSPSGTIYIYKEVSIHRASPVWFVHWLAIHRASPVPIYAIWLYTGLARTYYSFVFL